MGRFARTVVVALAGLAWPLAALAQQGGGHGTGTDLRRLRTEALKELPSAAGDLERPVAVTFTNGFTYNTNPNQQRNAAGADWHVNPDLELDVQRRLGGDFQLAASLDVNSDRFLRTTSANNDEVWAQLKLAYAGGAAPAWIPYVASRFNIDLVPDFARPALIYGDAFVGLARGYGFDAAGHPVVPDAAVHSLGIDVNAGRREAGVPARSAISAGSGTFLRLHAGYGYQVTETVSVSLAQAVEATFRDDDGPGSPARRDVLLLGVAAVEWTPAWLNRQHLRGGEIDLALQGATNRSTHRDATFRQADVGPFLFLRWRF